MARAGTPSGRRWWAQAGPVEADPTVAKRHVGVVADHEVIEQVDVQEAARRERLRGQVEVVGRGRGVAGRVVVDEDHAGSVQADGVPEQLAHADQRRADVALVGRHDPQHGVLREAHDGQLLAASPEDAQTLMDAYQALKLLAPPEASNHPLFNRPQTSMSGSEIHFNVAMTQQEMETLIH